MIKVISWNCRGLVCEVKKEMVKNILHSEKPQVLLLQEIKMKDFDVLQASSFFWKSSHGKEVTQERPMEGYAHYRTPFLFQLEDLECDSNWLLV
jgi:exonuclease III